MAAEWVDASDVLKMRRVGKSWQQKLADAWVGIASRAYALGQLAQCVNDALDKKLHTICEEFTSSYAA